MALFSRLLERRDTTYQQVWGADLDSPSSSFSTRPTRDKILGLSAVFACVRLLTDTVSTLPVHVYDDGGQVDPQPDWLARPVPRDPSITTEVHFQQVVSSLLLDGNAFVLVSPNMAQPAEVRVLDPRNVEIGTGPAGGLVYEVRDHRGGTVGVFDADQILHIPLIRLAGESRGLSPLEAERQLFAGSLAVEELGATFARNGLWLSGIVEVPAGSPGPADPDEFISRIERKWSGAGKAGKIGMLTGGATLKQLSVTPEQAQFLETMQYGDERIFRVFRCPPALVGMTKEGATSYASSVMQDKGFEKHTIRPLLRTIAPAYRQLLNPGQYLKFATKGLLEADPKTQAEIYHYGLTDTWLDVDEVRDLEDRRPFGGERGGKLQTPNNNAPARS